MAGEMTEKLMASDQPVIERMRGSIDGNPFSATFFRR